MALEGPSPLSLSLSRLLRNPRLFPRFNSSFFHEWAGTHFRFGGGDGATAFWIVQGSSVHLYISKLLQEILGVADLQTGHDETALPSIASQEATSTKFRWSGNMSKFLIDFLVKQEIIGAGVEKPFDKSTLLAAAKAVSEKFRTSCDVAKVENRLKSFKTKWTKVEKLKHLNGASWDPITKIISLRGDHYRDYVKVHPKDATLLNRPIKNYNELAILFTDDINTEEIGTKEETVGGHCERQPPTSTPGSSSTPSSRGRSSRFTRLEEANVVDIKNLVVKIGELIDAIKDLKSRDFSEELWNAISACDYNERMSVVAFEYFLKNEIEGRVFLVRRPEMRKEWLAKFFSSLL
uniref:Myb/SANT-like domain-containing protein n=1 Tax=Ananas comosus var. bracteatus TaxID=296719 RepID=A0A6V7Q7W7_ANACO|nr:unnamed protein product [Ananas comosus var. bracteatus]